MQLRGNRLLIYPQGNDSLESFLRQIDETTTTIPCSSGSSSSSSSSIGGDVIIIIEVELACMVVSMRQMRFVIRFLLDRRIQKLTLRCCYASPNVWKILLQTVGDSLVDLDWHRTNVLDEACLFLISSCMTQLKRFAFHSDKVEFILPRLLQQQQKKHQQLCLLDTLVLDGSLLNNEGSIQALMDYFRYNPAIGSLKNLSLTYCKIDKLNMRLVLQGIAKYVKNLQYLNVAGNQECDAEEDAMMNCISFLKRLDLSYQQQNDSPQQRQMVVLQQDNRRRLLKNPTMFSSSLSTALIQSTTLQTLRLAGNNLCDYDIPLIVSSIKQNYSFKNLDFSLNCFSRKGLELLLRPVLLEHIAPNLKRINVTMNNNYNNHHYRNVDDDDNDDLPEDWVLEMRKQNYTLEYFEHSYSGKFVQQINKICEWNRAGRKLLRTTTNDPCNFSSTAATTTTPIGLWSLVLEKSNSNIAFLFYLLQQGPSLLES
jgi:hypothetical protein